VAPRDDIDAIRNCLLEDSVSFIAQFLFNSFPGVHKTEVLYNRFAVPGVALHSEQI
jgi:hypothetical protein